MSFQFAEEAEFWAGRLRVRSAWLLASLPPSIFLLGLFALALYGAPEHDDFCFAYQNVRDGFVQTVLSFYNGLSGRVVPLLIIQIPAAIANVVGSSILPAYSLTLLAFALLFVVGSAFAMARMWPNVPGLPLLVLMLGFPAAVAGATPSIHDLLYWLPGLACYVPPALLTILIFGECVYALDRERAFSVSATVWMAIGGMLAAMCNEFTAVWLLLILASSLLGRRIFGQKLQIRHHLMIVSVVVAGWSVVALAPGNGHRAAAISGGWDLGLSIRDGLQFSLVGFRTLLFSPSIIGWLFLVVAISAATPAPEKQDRYREKLLALVITAMCLACCYFEYFLHQFITGAHLVDRAQNEALILITFGLTLSASFLARAYRSQIRLKLSLNGSPISIGKPVWPLLLAALMTGSIYFSSTASRIRREIATFGPFWLESVERDRMLTAGLDTVVTVPKHRWRPSALMDAEVTDNTGCVAMFYHNKEIIPVDAPGISSH